METAAVTNLPPNVTPDMLRADFWLDRAPDADTPLIASEETAAFNAGVYTTLDITAVLDVPDVLPRSLIEAEMRAYMPQSTLYGAKGEVIPPSIFERRLYDACIDGDPVSVRFGLVTQRTDVRAFPLACICLRDPFDFAIDRIQETTVDVGWPVAVVAIDPNETNYFCLTPHYWGWVRAEHVALGLRKQAAYHVTAEPFVVTIASQGMISLGTWDGRLTSQMGTHLPLTEGGNLPNETPDYWCLRLPVYAEEAESSYIYPQEGIVSRHMGDFHLGYLPPTLRSVFTQAFKLLGERYTWGGSRMGIFGRDCSRMIRDVYATTGVQLPRNGDQQAQVCREIVAFTPEMDDAARKAALVEQVPPGAILELAGHVML
ncbi:MAG: C40 family peptidase, partial [Anaerolineae bacterium]|nr:C40 family peptidase [Anaerolineae bacterium]